MGKSTADPVAEADLTVKKAHAILAELMTASAALTARDLAVKDERKKLAYAAHGTKDPRSQKRLSELHREHAELDSEQLSFADAIDEARRVLAAAEEAARLERERRRAREAIAMTEKMREHCVNCDRALKAFLEAYSGLDQVAASLAAIASAPTRDQVQSWARRSLATLFGNTRHREVFGLGLVPPQLRVDFTQGGERWSERIVAWAEARLTTPAPTLAKPENEVA
jgi:hypothetical protein